MFNKLSDLSNSIDGVEVLKLHPDEVYAVAQVRTEFTKEAIAELADNMSEVGQLQPCIVYPKDDSGYRLHVGERRWRAAKQRGLTLDVIVDPRLNTFNDQDKLSSQISENLQRDDLSPLEIAVTLKRLSDEFGMKGVEISKALGKNGSWVSRHLALFDMPELIKEVVYEAQGVRDAETLYQLVKLWKKDKATAEKLIYDGVVTRRTVQQANKGEVISLHKDAASGTDAELDQEPVKTPVAQAVKKAEPLVMELMLSKDEFVRVTIMGSMISDSTECKASYSFVVGGLDLADKLVCSSTPAAKSWAATAFSDILGANDQLDEAVIVKLGEWVDSYLLCKAPSKSVKDNEISIGSRKAEVQLDSYIDQVSVNEIKVLGHYKGEQVTLELDKAPRDKALIVVKFESGECEAIAAEDFKLLGIDLI